jgi:preprotein translocase SecF subunit
MKPDTTKKIKMMELVSPNIKIDFLKRTKAFIMAAVILIVVLDAVAIIRGLSNPASIFAVDFTGGAKVTFEVADKAKAPLEDVRAALEGAGVVDAKPQYQNTTEEVDGVKKEINFLEVSTVHTELNGTEISSVMDTALKGKLPEAGFKFIDVDSVGSQIGSEMKRTAYIAITLSAIAMLLYITLRFEFGFALGAIVALIHDVLITIGIFTALGMQFNLTIVAAMLTIVGYGVNDTIVLFDRVREELKLNNKLSFPELANKCINVTLSRTLLTSITTLITVVALLIFSSGDIFGFATCMLIGIIVSTFSTIYIATPVMLAWYKNKRPNFAKK